MRQLDLTFKEEGEHFSAHPGKSSPWVLSSVEVRFKRPELREVVLAVGSDASSLIVLHSVYSRKLFFSVAPEVLLPAAFKAFLFIDPPSQCRIKAFWREWRVDDEV